MQREQRKCAHPACNCAVDADAEYCSQYCEDAADNPEAVCKCPHAGCAGAGRVRSAQPS